MGSGVPRRAVLELEVVYFQALLPARTTGRRLGHQVAHLNCRLPALPICWSSRAGLPGSRCGCLGR